MVRVRDGEESILPTRAVEHGVSCPARYVADDRCLCGEVEVRSVAPGRWELVDVEGRRVGRITFLGHTYRASRRWGAPDDWRRVSQGFRSVDTAAAWIRKAVSP